MGLYIHDGESSLMQFAGLMSFIDWWLTRLQSRHEATIMHVSTSDPLAMHPFPYDLDPLYATCA